MNRSFWNFWRLLSWPVALPVCLFLFFLIVLTCLDNIWVVQGVLLAVMVLLLAGAFWTSRRLMRERDSVQQLAQVHKEELRQSEVALNNLFENAPIGIFRSTSDGRVLRANPVLGRMLRLDLREQKQKYRHDVENMFYVNPQQRADFLERLQAEGQVEQFEFQARRGDGTLAWFSMNARISEQPAEQPFIIDGFISEITQRKQAQESVEHLNKVLRAIRNINQLIMSEKDRYQLILQGCRILVQSRGFEAAMLILTDEKRRPTLYVQDGLADSFAQLIPTLKQGQLPLCCQQAEGSSEVCLIKKPSPTCTHCPLVHSCVHSDTLCIALQHMDRVHGYLTVALPQGQGDNAEEQSLLQELASDIAFALHGLEQEDKTRQAEEDKKVVEKQLAQAQKMEAIGRLAGGVAHDFNNMLGVITGYADLALGRLEKSDHLHYPLEQIKQAAERSADLTRQLLAFSRKQLTQPQVLDLNQEIESQGQMLAPLIGENIELDLRAADHLWPVEVDPSQVDQVLANLVINARDAITDIGTIILETMNVTLDQAFTSTYPYAQPGDYVCLMVSDTGVGMDPKTQEQIFDPFFTTKQGEHGTGLGLSTVYGIVKQNNGVIHVYSEQGRGTTFKLYFPRSLGAMSGKRGQSQTGPMQGNETVLLVEDEEMVLELTQSVLEEQGYIVLPTCSPGQAQQLAQEHSGPIHLLLTDVILPEMNGRELMIALEALRPEIKTLFMSGYTENVIVQQGMVDPQFFFIQKPFSAAGLTDTIRKVLSS